ncbi:unnamed protein product [Tetraodon nigroviridis]|uniref:(spotted green pufferfish) hypothetical protein n=1 Tax=Tetraodon nigroviridis TaxID=99883 RepID=Q4S4H1_TETNG|nr:unnamed protein product [Tetraodon nigroviridis]
MEFLLGNPFSTPVGHCIERATDGSLQSEDWALNMEICDIINETEDGRGLMHSGAALTLTGVVQVYEELKRKGIEFPTSDHETLSPIHTPQRAASAPEGDSTLLKYGNITSQPTSQTVPPPYSAPQVPNIHASGAINPTPEQICRLRSELDVVRGNTKVMSEMLTEMVPGQEDASDYELLQASVLSEATEDNLIDLGPGSPAVVSNMANAAPANLPSSPATLASRLAGLDVGADSVSSTLSSLSSCKPPPTQDDFDVFAQTRTGALSTPAHTSTTAEDRTASSGPPPTLDVLQPAPGMGVGRQASVMDDIEQWLCTDVKGDEGEEGVTSEEFDKFLEERAKAAEMTPSMAPPPSADPGTTQETPNRKKPARPENGLLAM